MGLEPGLADSTPQGLIKVAPRLAAHSEALLGKHHLHAPGLVDSISVLRSCRICGNFLLQSQKGEIQTSKMGTVFLCNHRSVIINFL